MENVLIAKEGHVATITINRPKALNALSTAVLTDLNAALDEV
ncbi:enoyl-CoA hydratase, partial [Pseudomonas otitidis]|nr:enoyl-CoA hydratase [Pseudomonas otitidis]